MPIRQRLCHINDIIATRSAIISVIIFFFSSSYSSIFFSSTLIIHCRRCGTALWLSAISICFDFAGSMPGLYCVVIASDVFAPLSPSVAEHCNLVKVEKVVDNSASNHCGLKTRKRRFARRPCELVALFRNYLYVGLMIIFHQQVVDKLDKILNANSKQIYNLTIKKMHQSNCNTISYYLQ